MQQERSRRGRRQIAPAARLPAQMGPGAALQPETAESRESGDPHEKGHPFDDAGASKASVPMDAGIDRRARRARRAEIGPDARTLHNLLKYSNNRGLNTEADRVNASRCPVPGAFQNSL